MKLEEALKVRKFKSNEQRAALNISYTAAWLNERINAVLKPYGISEQQYNVLRILRGQGDKPATLHLIQERMVHKMSNATRLVEKLRQKGLVNRRECPENRRQVEITITQKGKDMLKTIESERLKLEQDLFQNLEEEEVVQLADLLDKLRG